MEMILPFYFHTVDFGVPVRTFVPACHGICTHLSSILGWHIPRRTGLVLDHLYSLQLLVPIKYLIKFYRF